MLKIWRGTHDEAARKWDVLHGDNDIIEWPGVSLFQESDGLMCVHRNVLGVVLIEDEVDA